MKLMTNCDVFGQCVTLGIHWRLQWYDWQPAGYLAPAGLLLIKFERF